MSEHSHQRLPKSFQLDTLVMYRHANDSETRVLIFDERNDVRVVLSSRQTTKMRWSA